MCEPTGALASATAPVQTMCDKSGVCGPCDPTKPGCNYAFTAANELPYCLQDTDHAGGTGVHRQLECRDLDSFNTVGRDCGCGCGCVWLCCQLRL